MFECRGATVTWTNPGLVNNFWTITTNWSPQVRPQFGDSLVFPGNSISYNDILGLTVSSITFNPGGTPRISGNLLGVTVGLTNLGSGQARVDLNIQLSGGSPFIFSVNGAGPINVSGQLSSAVPVVPIRKLGPGVLSLTGNNIHSGVTYVENGILSVGYDAALGSNGPSDGTEVRNGGTLQLMPGTTLNEPLTLTGTGFGGTNGSLMATGAVTVSGSLVLSNAATVNVGFNSTLVYDGTVSGTGPLTKTGLGRFIFAGGTANNYSGDTIVNAGTLELTKSVSVVSVPGDLVIGPETAGGPYVIARLNQNGAIGGSVLTVNEKGVFDLNGFTEAFGQVNLNDGGSIQMGTGSLRFSSRSPLVQVGSLSPEGSSASSSISGRMQLATNVSLTFNVAPFNPSAPLGLLAELEVPAVIASDFDRLGEARSRIHKQGLGRMRLSANNSTFTGGVTADTGVLIVANALALGTTTDSTTVNGGGSLALEGNITVNNEGLSLSGTSISALENRSGLNVWNGPIFVSANGGVGVSAGTLQLLGTIEGGGSLTKSGPGTLLIGGTANNTHAGNTYVNEGTVQLAKSAFIQAVPHDLIIGSNALATYFNPDQVWANITVNFGGLLDLNGYDEYAGLLTLNQGGRVQTGNGTLYLPSDGITVNPGVDTTSLISGKLAFGPGSHTIQVGSGSSNPSVHEMIIDAAIRETSPSATLQKTGPGALLLTGVNIHTGTNIVEAGRLIVNGVQTQSIIQVNGGARLQGTGSAGVINFGANTGIVSPGLSPGILTGNNFNINDVGGILEIELNGPAAGSGYDQLNIGTTVNLRGVTLSASLNYPSSTNDQFIIIANAGTDPVLGTFNNLPQGAKFFASGELFQIDYAGGTGNDVVLRRLATPGRPVLKIEPLPPAAVRLSWPTSAPPFSLQWNTNVANASGWTPALPPPSVVGTNYFVTNTTIPFSRFYRLSYP